MTGTTFVLIIVLILIATFVFTLASLLLVEYMFYRTKRMQLEMLEEMEKSIDDPINEALALFND